MSNSTWIHMMINGYDLASAIETSWEIYVKVVQMEHWTFKCILGGVLKAHQESVERYFGQTFLFLILFFG